MRARRAAGWLGLLCAALLLAACAPMRPMGVSDMTWQPTQDGLRHLVLLRPVDDALPPGPQIEDFLLRLQDEAAAQQQWGDVRDLRVEVTPRGRWLAASFTFEFTDWQLVGQIVSPDALVSRGDLELVPRAANRAVVGGEIDPETIRRAWTALRAALQAVAQRAGQDSGLGPHLPPAPAV